MGNVNYGNYGNYVPAAAGEMRDDARKALVIDGGFC